MSELDEDKRMPEATDLMPQIEAELRDPLSKEALLEASATLLHALDDLVYAARHVGLDERKSMAMRRAVELLKIAKEGDGGADLLAGYKP